jgi:HTH-type transcriptional regulator/antitoxin HigA
MNDRLGTSAEYEHALKEIEQYFDDEPKPGTKEAARFRRLIALIKEYEDANFPIPER